MSFVVPKHRCLILRDDGKSDRPDADIVFGLTPTPTPAPSWSAQPAISGTARVGETLTVSTGTIVNGSLTARQWRRNGTAISGATASTYALIAADLATLITCQLTATGAGGSASTTTAAVGPVAASSAAVDGDPIALTATGATPLDVQGGIGVDGERWTATVKIKGMAAGGVCDATKLTLTVSDPGYSTTGSVTTVTRTITGYAVLRQQMVAGNTGRVTSKMIYASGSDVEMTVALSDIIYSGTTIVSATLASGFYTVGGVPSAASATDKLTLTNASTAAYLKPHAIWDDLPYRRETGSTVRCAVIAAHRHGRNAQMVPFVRYELSDGTATATGTCGLPVLSTVGGSIAPECYAANVSVTSLANGPATRNAKIYPWIGDASAVLDMALDRPADATRLQQRQQPFVVDRTGAYGGAIAYVRAPVALTAQSSTAFNASFLAAQAFDASDTTAFHSTASADPWLGGQYAAAVAIRRVGIMPATAYLSVAPTALVLEYSSDGTAWTQWGTTWTAPAWVAGTRQIADFGAGAPAATYWRIRRPGGTTAIAIATLHLIRDGDTTTNPGGTVSKVDATAKAAPFPSLEVALAALAAFNGANAGHADHSGSTIYLMDDLGGPQVHMQSANAGTVAAGGCWTEIKVDPAATGAVTWGGSKSAGLQQPSLLLWSVPTTPNASQPLFMSASPSTNLAIGFENVTVSSSGFSPAFGWADRFYRNVTELSPDAVSIFTLTGWAATQRAEVSYAAGCNYPARAISTGCAIANRSAMSQPTGVNGRDPADGLFWVNNHCRSTGITVQAAAPERGLYFVQNLIERVYVVGGANVISLNINADGASGDVIEALEIHGAAFGERGSRNYCDVTATIGQRRKFLQIGTILQNVNKKTDTFGTPETRTGNWEWCYSCGSDGNVYIDGSVTGTAPNNEGSNATYLGMYIPPGTSYAALADAAAAAFVAPKAFRNATSYDGGNALGGGDYNLTSHAAAAPFKNKIPAGRAMLRYDLQGRVRRNDGSGAAGPLEWQAS